MREPSNLRLSNSQWQRRPWVSCVYCLSTSRNWCSKSQVRSRSIRILVMACWVLSLTANTNKCTPKKFNSRIRMLTAMCNSSLKNFQINKTNTDLLEASIRRVKCPLARTATVWWPTPTQTKPSTSNSTMVRISAKRVVRLLHVWMS